MSTNHHARVLEGVAKSQFPPQGSGFQKSKAWISTLSNEFTPSNTLAWHLVGRGGDGHERRARVAVPLVFTVYGLGLGFRVWDLGFRVEGLGFRLQGLGIMV